MNVVDLVALTLATGGLVDCWLNGSIFAGFRERLQGWTLFSCDYCLNWQAPIWLFLASYVPSLFLPYPWSIVARMPIYCMGAAYAAWMINEIRARGDCDYRRTARAGESEGRDDSEGYESPEDRVSESLGTGPDAGTNVRTAPALMIGDMTTHHFCSTDCRRYYISSFGHEGKGCVTFLDTATPGEYCETCGKEF